jgi:ubiquitin carboxyl-terminal hydrolase 25/28
MEDREAPRPRRPLPTPQRPNTPVPGSSASLSVAPATFYQNPPLPARPSSLGSSHTTYVAPEDPPPYSSSHGRSPTYREPEFIAEESDIPDLVPSNGTWNNTTGWGEQTDPWVPDAIAMDYTAVIKSIPDVVIDGRDGYQEANWWNESLREKCQRPGPGMLPPVLAEQLHDLHHSLFSVGVTSPDIRMPSHAAAPSSPGSTSSLAHDLKSGQLSSARAALSSSPARTSSPIPSAPPPPPPPTADDVRTAVPHPNAYYCPKENGWVILSWKSSSVAPPLAQSFQNSRHHPLPYQDRRKRTESCISDGVQPFGTNKTHHFHKYENAIDAHKLTPPFHREEWEDIEIIKQRRRTATLIQDDIDVTKMSVEQIEAVTAGELETEGEGILLDLYICCQCSFYCVASGVISGVIPRKSFDEFAKEKRSNPPPGKTGDQSVVTAFETIVT